MFGGIGGSVDWRRIGRLAKPAAMVTALLLAATAGPPWFRALVTQSTQNHATIRLLMTARAWYIALLVIVPMAIIGLAAAVILTRRRARLAWAGRGLALCVAVALGMIAAEGVSAARLARMRIPMPVLATTFPDRPGEADVDIVVLGESSARGVPYHDWLSVGEIVGWKLQEAFPNRRFPVTQLAQPGLKLDEVHMLLRQLTRRPDLVILYAGHNEFQMRYDWAHGAYHYLDETPPERLTFPGMVSAGSRVCRLIDATVGLIRRASPPKRTIERQLVDVPVYTPAEYAQILQGFRARLEAMTSYCEGLGAQVVLVIPPGNDADFEPNRSFLPPETTRAERMTFARDFEAARRLETADPAKAVAAYRALLERQPGFAEVHYRLARRLEALGEIAEANTHYIAARDQDGLPMRCPSDFQNAYREVAKRHPSAILVDGPAELRDLSPRGTVGDTFFTDGFHPSLIGYTELAQAILTGLRDRRAIEFRETTPTPVVSPPDCARHFGMDPDKWQQVCGYAAWFYYHASAVRFDGSRRLAKMARYQEASRRIHAGVPPGQVGMPGVGSRITPPTRLGLAAAPAGP